MLEQIRALLRAALDERAAAQSALDKITEAPAAESRDLNEDETKAFGEARESLKSIDERVASLREREADFVAQDEARAAAKAIADKLGAPNPSAPAVVRSEPHTYTAESERRGTSFIRDLVTSKFQGDDDARDRLGRHKREMVVDGVERRDVAVASFAGLVVPQYLTNLAAPIARAAAPTVAICRKLDLPPDGMTVNISRITTGTTVTEQTAEAQAASETDIDDTLLTVDVRTYSGMQDLSRQVIDRGTGTDAIVIQDLVAAYWTKIDAHVLDGGGGTGTLPGIYGTSGVNSVTYTAGTADAAGLYAKLGAAISAVQSNAYAYGGVSHFIMHPRRWWWLAAQAGTSFPFLQAPSTEFQQAGTVGGTEYNGMGRQVLGVPVVVDGNIDTTDGSGTDEDYILAVTDRELFLWSEPGAPLRIRAEEPLANTLQVRFVIWGYHAFTAGRYPKAHAKVTGTGLNDTL